MNQTWGLIIADPNEIHDSGLKFLKTSINGKNTFSHYQWNDIEIITIESGIGLVNASMITQKIIDTYNVDKILNYGAVGGSNNLNLFDVIIPKNFYFHDVETPWYPRGQTPGENSFYCNSFKINDNHNIASGNSFIYKETQLKSIKNDLPVDLFDMESSAIAQVCHKNEIPFFCIKGISDIINFTNTENEKINENISISSKKALKKLISMFDIISTS